MLDTSAASVVRIVLCAGSLPRYIGVVNPRPSFVSLCRCGNSPLHCSLLIEIPSPSPRPFCLCSRSLPRYIGVVNPSFFVSLCRCGEFPRHCSLFIEAQRHPRPAGRECSVTPLPISAFLLGCHILELLMQTQSRFPLECDTVKCFSGTSLHERPPVAHVF